jgi:hypothetical protein
LNRRAAAGRSDFGPIGHIPSEGRVSSMDKLDRDLCRAHEIFMENLSDETDTELAKILPALIEAGYVKESGHSPTGSFWAFTKAGVERGKELGCS